MAGFNAALGETLKANHPLNVCRAAHWERVFIGAQPLRDGFIPGDWHPKTHIVINLCVLYIRAFHIHYKCLRERERFGSFQNYNSAKLIFFVITILDPMLSQNQLPVNFQLNNAV